jgi:hypothetical protein
LTDFFALKPLKPLKLCQGVILCKQGGGSAGVVSVEKILSFLKKALSGTVRG